MKYNKWYIISVCLLGIIIFCFLWQNKTNIENLDNKEETWINDNAISEEETVLFFTPEECIKTWGIMVVPGFESPFTPTVNLPNFFDYSDTICGTSGTLLGSEQSDAVGSYCCRYEETA